MTPDELIIENERLRAELAALTHCTHRALAVVRLALADVRRRPNEPNALAHPAEHLEAELERVEAALKACAP